MKKRPKVHLADQFIVWVRAENPTVEISYASNTLKPFVDFKSDETVDMKLLKQNNLTRTNVHNCIAKFVPCDYANKISAGGFHTSAKHMKNTLLY